MKKNKIKIKIIDTPQSQELRWFVDYEVNFTKLYDGCNKSKYDWGGQRWRRDQSISRKISKAQAGYTIEEGYRSRAAAVKLANKLAKISEVKSIKIYVLMKDKK